MNYDRCAALVSLRKSGDAHHARRRENIVLSPRINLLQNHAMNEGNDALTFFREMVEPTVTDFLGHPDDRRLGCLACLCLASMTDHFFHARPQSRDGCDNADEFRRNIGKSCWVVAQVIGVANATKHVERRRGRVGYQDVTAQEIDCANLRCGWPISGAQVMVEVKEGEVWLLSDLVKAALAFWRDRFVTQIAHSTL